MQNVFIVSFKLLKNMDFIVCIVQYFEDSVYIKLDVVEVMVVLIVVVIEILINSLINGGKIFVCGNGGLVGDLQYFVVELVGCFEVECQELVVIVLIIDSFILIVVGNDYLFNQIFFKQVWVFGYAGDVLFVILIFGNFNNVIEVIRLVYEVDMCVVVLIGKGGGQIGEMFKDDDIYFCVLVEWMVCIQEIYLFVIYCLCDGIDVFFLGVE